MNYITMAFSKWYNGGCKLDKQTQETWEEFATKENPEVADRAATWHAAVLWERKRAREEKTREEKKARKWDFPMFTIEVNLFAVKEFLIARRDDSSKEFKEYAHRLEQLADYFFYQSLHHKLYDKRKTDLATNAERLRAYAEGCHLITSFKMAWETEKL